MDKTKVQKNSFFSLKYIFFINNTIDQMNVYLLNTVVNLFKIKIKLTLTFEQ